MFRGLFRGCLLAILAAIAGGAGDEVAAAARPPAGAEAARSVRPLLDRALDASGVPEGDEREAWVERFTGRILPLVEKAAQARSDLRSARRLHRLLHQELFRKYSFGDVGIPALLERGEFNCVSATLVEGIGARLLGIAVRVAEGPKHVFLRMKLRGREVEVEAASDHGFDRHWAGARAKGFLLAYKLATPQEIIADPSMAVDAYRQVRPPVELEEATAFLRYNAALGAEERGDAAASARQLARAVVEHPAFRERADEIGVIFARAFRTAYDAGRYGEALEIAGLDLATIPDRASAKDRLLAAAARRVEELSDEDNLQQAEALMDAVSRDHPDIASRLDRAVCPAAVLAAVRDHDFDRARRLAARFDGAASGIPEGASLVAWVRSRQSADSRGRPQDASGNP